MKEIFNDNEYSVDGVDALVDTNSGKILDKEDVKPFDQIKSIAKTMGYSIKDPNPKCKRCYGRGYIGFNVAFGNRTPVPCDCIYDKKEVDDLQNNHGLQNLNRRQKRNLIKNMRKNKKR
jgi:hypothetical protein